MSRLTIQMVNDHIHTKYPLVDLVKGKGYFYIASDDDNIGLQIAGLYTSSIDVAKINHLTLGGWMDATERVLSDYHRYGFDEAPVKF